MSKSIIKSVDWLLGVLQKSTEWDWKVYVMHELSCPHCKKEFQAESGLTDSGIVRKQKELHLIGQELFVPDNEKGERETQR